ncbi:hypothetical protein [Hahella chejuensis]|nr:hypothetical protein [Hahella chejuensis]
MADTKEAKKKSKNALTEFQMEQWARELDTTEGLERLGREAAEWAKKKSQQHQEKSSQKPLPVTR